MTRRSPTRSDAHAAVMRERQHQQQQIENLRRRYGSVGPLCPACQSPLGCRRYYPEFQCRACGHLFSLTRPRPFDAPLAWTQRVLSESEQRRRDLLAVYRRDCFPYNATTRRAMQRKRRR
jgi:hypothetical protein